MLVCEGLSWLLISTGGPHPLWAALFTGRWTLAILKKKEGKCELVKEPSSRVPPRFLLHFCLSFWPDSPHYRLWPGSVSLLKNVSSLSWLGQTFQNSNWKETRSSHFSFDSFGLRVRKYGAIERLGRDFKTFSFSIERPVQERYVTYTVHLEILPATTGLKSGLFSRWPASMTTCFT